MGRFDGATPFPPAPEGTSIEEHLGLITSVLEPAQDLRDLALRGLSHEDQRLLFEYAATLLEDFYPHFSELDDQTLQQAKDELRFSVWWRRVLPRIQLWLFWGLWRCTVGRFRNRKDAKETKTLAKMVGVACENREMKISAGQRRRLSRIAQKYDLRLVLAFGSCVTGQRHPRQ